MKNNIHSNNRDTLFSSTSKTDFHDITEVLLKVVLNTITLTPSPIHSNMTSFFHFVSKPAIYLLCKLSLAHARSVHTFKPADKIMQ